MNSVSKMFLIVTVTCLRTISGQGQSTTDTICLPVPVVKKIMAAADSTPILRERVSLLNQDVSLLGQINANLRIKDSLNVEIIKAEREKSVIMQEQRGLYDTELSNMRNLYKKERRKRIWTQVFGIVGISGALFLGLNL